MSLPTKVEKEKIEMRQAKFSRETKETSIGGELKLDGSGRHSIDTTIPFLNHMLILMTAHGLLDLKLKASGDTEVDLHHTVEDVGICLGKALKQALGEKKGIRRYGTAFVPMDESLGSAHVDLSGRPCLVYHCSLRRKKIGNFDIELVKEFFQAFVNNAAITLHVQIAYGSNGHHMVEALFKAFGRALRQAAAKDERVRGVLSTKGRL
jgi:imidazoleglycerol-phosphate dehydratase